MWLQRTTSLLLCCSWLSAASGTAARADESLDELNLKSSNPIADLVSVPFQNNFNFNYGPGSGSDQGELRYNLNFQPVVPISLNDHLNLITRTIVPVIATPYPSDTTGMGDINFSAFFSPKRESGLIWGLGPILQFNTATNDSLGSGKWAIGPTAVFLYQEGKLQAGALIYQLWSYAGDSARPPLSTFQFQPFMSYVIGRGLSLTASSQSIATWHSPSGQKWTVPLGGGINQVLVIKKTPITFGVQYFTNVVHPDIGPTSQLRVTISFLYPSSPTPSSSE